MFDTHTMDDVEGEFQKAKSAMHEFARGFRYRYKPLQRFVVRFDGKLTYF